MANENDLYCVTCGAYCGEGRMVCVHCETQTQKYYPYPKHMRIGTTHHKKYKIRRRYEKTN